MVLEKTLKSLLDSKEIQPVLPKGNQSCILIGRTDAEAPMLWLPDEKSQFTGNDPDAEKDWKQKEKRAAENEMLREHQRPSLCEFKQTPGDSRGRGSLPSCNPWGHRESDRI